MVQVPDRPVSRPPEDLAHSPGRTDFWHALHETDLPGGFTLEWILDRFERREDRPEEAIR